MPVRPFALKIFLVLLQLGWNQVAWPLIGDGIRAYNIRLSNSLRHSGKAPVSNRIMSVG